MPPRTVLVIGSLAWSLVNFRPDLMRRLRDHARGADTAQREVVVPLCTALEDLIEERWRVAARRLERLLPRLHAVGGSAAQREVVEETLLYAQIRGGRHGAARSRLEARLERRSSPHDRSRLAALADRGKPPAGA